MRSRCQWNLYLDPNKMTQFCLASLHLKSTSTETEMLLLNPTISTQNNNSEESTQARSRKPWNYHVPTLFVVNGLPSKSVSGMCLSWLVAFQRSLFSLPHTESLSKINRLFTQILHWDGEDMIGTTTNLCSPFQLRLCQYAWPIVRQLSPSKATNSWPELQWQGTV